MQPRQVRGVLFGFGINKIPRWPTSTSSSSPSCSSSRSRAFLGRTTWNRLPTRTVIAIPFCTSLPPNTGLPRDSPTLQTTQIPPTRSVDPEDFRHFDGISDKTGKHQKSRSFARSQNLPPTKTGGFGSPGGNSTKLSSADRVVHRAPTADSRALAISSRLLAKVRIQVVRLSLNSCGSACSLNSCVLIKERE